MSQHRFDHGKLEILAGWDKPLQHFFLVVEKEGRDDPIYSNLFDSSANGLEDCSYFKMKLAELGVSAPPGFWAAIEADREYNMGNSARLWSERIRGNKNEETSIALDCGETSSTEGAN